MPLMPARIRPIAQRHFSLKSVPKSDASRGGDVTSGCHRQVFEVGTERSSPCTRPQGMLTRRPKEKQELFVPALRDGRGMAGGIPSVPASFDCANEASTLGYYRSAPTGSLRRPTRFICSGSETPVGDAKGILNAKLRKNSSTNIMSTMKMRIEDAVRSKFSEEGS